MDKVFFTDENGNQEVFYCIEQTRLAGKTYLLVTDREEGDADCWILKDISKDEDPQAQYCFVEDDDELEAVSAVFGELLEDIDLR